MDALQGLFTKNIYRDHDICLKDREFIKDSKVYRDLAIST